MKENKRQMVNIAKIMTKVAKISGVMAANTRCVSIYHQPKMPAGLRKLKNK